MPPAARVGDMHTCPMVTPGTPPIPHVGGPILPAGCPTVLIGFLPAARVGDMAVCVGPPDSIVKGSMSVMIGNMPAARLGDQTAHGGVIVVGFPTVMIGDSGSGGGGGGGAGVSGSSSAAAKGAAGPGPGMETDFATAFTMAKPLIGKLRTAARFGIATVGSALADTLGVGETAPDSDSSAAHSLVSKGSDASSSTSTELPLDVQGYNSAMLAKAKTSVTFFSGHQTNKDTCALMSVNSVFYEQTGSKSPPKPHSTFFNTLEDLWAAINIAGNTPANEKEMIDIGHASGAYSWCSGTTDIAAVMNAAGIPSESVSSPSLETIAESVEDGKGVVVGYDTRPVWGGRWLQRTQPAGHAVRVTAVERDSNGEISAFYINDSGDGVAPKRVPADVFTKALDGFGGGVMAVSEEPLFTPVYPPSGSLNDYNQSGDSNRFV